MFRSNVVSMFVVGVGAMELAIVGIVAAACPDMKVRPNSPCKTTLKTCVYLAENASCSPEGEETSAGNFQCDLFNPGTTCTGSGWFAQCYRLCACKETGPTRCEMNYNTCQAYTQETKVTISCPEG